MRSDPVGILYFRCPACRQVYSLKDFGDGEYHEKHVSMEMAVAMALRKKLANVYCNNCSVLDPVRRHTRAMENFGEKRAD